ncbi:MAG: ABC transporter permease, partial [Acidobacteriaceae bacterium]|nr:ABC transporter permease [Acidobacteriaceae bacterium]
MALNTLGADLRYGLRSMRKNVGFTAVAVAALGLGIGANTAIFSIARAVVLAPLPFPHADRLVEFSTISRKTGLSDTWVSYRDVFDWRQRNRSFESIGAYSFLMLNLTGGNEPVALYGSRISYDLFPTLGVQPELGRNFLSEEDRPGQAQEIILSHDLWVNRFEADPHIIGRTIRLIGRRESEQYVVVGVMAPRFNFPLNIPSSVNPPSRQMAYWVPIGLRPSREHSVDLDVMAIGLLRSGVSIQRAQGDMASVARTLERDYPDTNLGRGVEVAPLKDQILGRAKAALLLLLLAISAVVLITCVNIANLLLSRALGRTRETGIRLALGASRMRLVQQWLAESLSISILGGCVGLFIAYCGLRTLVSLAPQDIPRLGQVRLDFEVLLFTAGISIAAGLLFGNLPAWSAARTGVSAALTESGVRITADRRRVRVRDFLVVSEVSLAVLLAIGAGLLVK